MIIKYLKEKYDDNPIEEELDISSMPFSATELLRVLISKGLLNHRELEDIFGVEIVEIIE